MKMGLQAGRVRGRPRSAGGCAPSASTGCDPALTAEMGAMRFPPSSTALQHYIDLVGLETRPFPNPLAAGDPVDRRRPQGRVALRRRPWTTCRRSTARSMRRLERLPGGGRRLLRHAAGAMRERDVAAHPRDLGAAGREARQPDLLRLPLRLRRPSSPSATARSSARSASAPAAGTPTSPTPSWRSCASSTPSADDHHRGIVGGSQQLPLRLWEREPRQDRALAARHLAGVAARTASRARP